MILSEELKVEEEDEEEEIVLKDGDNNKEKKGQRRSALLEGDLWHWKVGGFSVESQFNKMQVYFIRSYSFN